MLLGFLPLATAAGIATVLIKELQLTIPLKPQHWCQIDPKPLPFTPIGIFGFLVTLGLYFFELYGIKKCRALIETGIYLEKRMGGVVQFATRPNRAMHMFNEPVAGANIYGAVMGAWILIACLFSRGLPLAGFIGTLAFIVSCAVSIVYAVLLESGKSLDHLEPLQLVIQRAKP